ncbi:MAG: hypothetical protein HFJ02_06430 [Bacilli bacterium]|nr:hypothetical protein [Bacilli bacterium]
MKKREKLLNKKTVKVVLNTFLVLGVLEFTIYPETNSKYLDSPEQAAFSYQANLYSLYKGLISNKNVVTNKNEQISLGTSTYKVMSLNLSFTRNENIIKDASITKDTFSLELPNSCTFDQLKLDSKKVTHTVSKEGEAQKITFSLDNTKNKDKIEQIITANIKCPVEVLSKDNLYHLSFPIEEYVNDEQNEKFTSWDVTFEVSKEYYHRLYPIPQIEIDLSKRQLIIPNDFEGDKLLEFETFIKEYVNYYADNTGEDVLKFSESIASYAYNEYVDFIKNNGGSLKKKDIHGMTALCDDVECVYTIQDNFIGYAKTEMTKNNASNVVYFSDITSLGSVDSTKLNEILKYYLYTYVYKDEKLTDDGKNEKADKVYEYLLESCERDIRKIFDKSVKAPNGISYIQSTNSLIFEDADKFAEISKQEKIKVDRVLKDDNTVDLGTMLIDLNNQFKTLYPNSKLNFESESIWTKFFIDYIGNNKDFRKVFLNESGQEVATIFDIKDSNYSNPIRYFQLIVEPTLDSSSVTLIETDEFGVPLIVVNDGENNKPIPPSDSTTSSGGPDDGVDSSIMDNPNKIEDLEVPETVLDGVTNLVIDEEQDGLKVVIDAKNSENIVSIVESLDEHFSITEPTTLPANTFIPKEDGSFEAVYTIKTK